MRVTGMSRRALPDGLSYAGRTNRSSDVAFLSDTTWTDDGGTRRSRQQIFDAVFERIRRARRFVLLDMFLYNEFPMGVSDALRPLSRELTDLLVQQKRSYPEMRIVVITDPVNTVYGSVPSCEFAELRDAGIELVMTDLERLPDSNLLYSVFWRLFVRPFGNAVGGRLPNPFDPRSKVTLRSYLAIPNFKANHRKVVIADDGDKLLGIVSSANPHDASSAYTNAACVFGGAAVNDLLQSENAVLQLCGRQTLDVAANGDEDAGDVTVQVLTERPIKVAALDLIAGMQSDERLDVAMLYLSDRDVVESLKHARQRGVHLRVLLDPNDDAFGRNTFGIPNRPVAAELVRSGIDVRWCHALGAQCHNKMILGVCEQQPTRLLFGSANMTRRNLENFNLETDVLVCGPLSAPAIGDARSHFDRLWSNRPGKTFSVPYERYRDESRFKRGCYRFMEATGFCTF